MLTVTYTEGTRVSLSKGLGKDVKLKISRDFPGGPVIKTPRFHCRGHRFDPWSGN